MQITTLVPAYKPHYLIELLTALRHQTVKPVRIIFSDDSPDQAFVQRLSSEPLKSLVADLPIEVVSGPRRGGYNNFRHLLQLYRSAPAPSALFHLLLDDDVIFPSFYALHLAAHQQARLPCVVSRRWAATESGQPIQDDLPVPDLVAAHSSRMLSMDAATLFAHTVGASKNWLGEFSNATFRSEMAAELDDTRMAGISYAGLEDLGGMLKASLHGPLGFIQDHLGYFRKSGSQNSSDPMGRPLKTAFLAYISLAMAARDLRVLSAEQAAQAVQRTSQFVQFHYSQQEDMRGFCALMPRLAAHEAAAEAEFLQLWRAYSSSPAQPLPA